jgi:hypothetical protein
MSWRSLKDAFAASVMLGMQVLGNWEDNCSESFRLVVARSEVGRSLAAADVGWAGEGLGV